MGMVANVVVFILLDDIWLKAKKSLTVGTAATDPTNI